MAGWKLEHVATKACPGLDPGLRDFAGNNMLKEKSYFTQVMRLKAFDAFLFVAPVPIWMVGFIALTYLKSLAVLNPCFAHQASAAFFPQPLSPSEHQFRRTPSCIGFLNISPAVSATCGAGAGAAASAAGASGVAGGGAAGRSAVAQVMEVKPSQ